MRNQVREVLESILTFFRKHVSRKHDEFPYYLLIFFSFIVFVVGINFFVELTERLQGDILKTYDQKILVFFASFRNPELNSVIEFLTDMGDLYAYIIVTTLVTLFLFVKLKNWKFILQLLGVIILSSLSNIALKKAINRARPDAEHLVVVESLSYPSGHAMSAMAFYGFLIYLLFHIKMPKRIRTGIAFIFGTLILGIGLSRIYLGVHYPSDVVAGFLGGLIWITFCIVLFNLIDLLRRRKRNNRELEENLET